MAVERYDNPLRYFVDSRSRKGVRHLVELDAHGGNGQCTCEDFKWARTEKLKARGGKPSDDTRCEHIKQARSALADEIIRNLTVLAAETEEAQAARSKAKSKATKP